MNHKPQIRTALASLNQVELFQVLDGYLAVSASRLQKTTKEISIKCFECSVKVKSKTAVGFGRNEAEALTNSVRNLMEALVDDDKTFGLLRTAIANNAQQSVTTELSVTEQTQHFKALTLTTKHNSDQPKDQRHPKKEEISDQNSRQASYYTSSSMKIKYPNSSVKPRLHDSYMSQSVDYPDPAMQLKRAHDYIRDLENKIKQASAENQSLRSNLGKLTIEDLTASPIPQIQQPAPIQPHPSNLDALQFKIHAKVRSISVEQSSHSPLRQSQPAQPASRPSCVMTESTHANLSTLEDSKKESLRVPRLKLEQLPNYHGRSNKSLNQSLMDAYTKNKK